MNLKTVFGSILTILGAITLIYAAYSFINEEQFDWRDLLVAAGLGLLFFSAGLGLIKQV